MAGDRVPVMISLMIIFAVFLWRKRSFIQWLGLICLYKWGGGDKLFLFCHSNNETIFQLRKHKTMWVYPRSAQFWLRIDLAEELEKSKGVGGIVNQKKWLLELLFAMWSCQAQPRGNCLANNNTRLFDRHLHLYARPDWLWFLSGQVIPSREVVIIITSVQRIARGLVDFAIGLVNPVLNLREGQVKFFGKSKFYKNCSQYNADV